MQIRITESAGNTYKFIVEDEPLHSFLAKIEQESGDFVTFQVTVGDKIHEIAIAKEQIVSVVSVPQNDTENKRRKERKLLF